MLRTTTLKVSAAVLVAFTLIATSIALAYADDPPSAEPDEVALSAPPSEEPAVELEDERTATTQTFLLPDGSRETRIYEAPINYRDPEGVWQPIDESLEETAGDALSNGQNSFDVTLPSQLES